MTAAQLVFARFSLGLPNPFGVGRPRDYYCQSGEDDEVVWRALASCGLSELRQVNFGVFAYRLTFSGACDALQPGERLDASSFVDTPISVDTAALT